MLKAEQSGPITKPLWNGAGQQIKWCSFLKNSPETFRSEIHFGAFFGSFAFEKCFSKSLKVFRIVLQYFGDLFCKTKLERSF